MNIHHIHHQHHVFSHLFDAMMRYVAFDDIFQHLVQ